MQDVTQEAVKAIPWGAVVAVNVAVLILVGLDKAGYYIKRKGLNGKAKNGSEDLAKALVEQLADIATKPDANGDTKFIPGFSPTCVEHTGDIREIKTELPHIKTGIEKLGEKVDEKHDALNEKLDEIKRGVNGGT